MADNLTTTCVAVTPSSVSERERIADILDGYMQGLEAGRPLSPEELVALHPELADALRGYLSGLQLFHDALGSPQSHTLSAGKGTAVWELGDFRVEREIGRGGMGVVYEGVQISLGRRVAIKVLPHAAAVDAKQISRFKNEAQAAAQVDHPNIVPVFAIGQEHGIYYFAMQLIAGRSLSDLLSDLRGESAGESGSSAAGSPDRALGTEEHIRRVAEMGIQVAEALHAAHEIGVVHRDVKPSNLLIDEKGKVWVTDFGVARCKSNVSITETGLALGTIRYMSPEQAQGHAALVDHRTDVYSLGVSLYELATLEHPFEDVPIAAMSTDLRRGNPPRLRHWNHAIAIDFENIVLKAMADTRDDRYATAGELADDLRRFLAGESILARRPSLTSRCAKWAKRHKRSVAAAIGVAVLVLTVTFASLVAIARERSEKDEAYRTAATNYEQAQSKFRQAREMLDRFGSRVAEKLASVPGAEGVRKELLAEMLPYYREFARESAGEPILRSELALTFSKIGDLSDQLGSQTDAEQAYEDAQSLFEQLAQTQPLNSEHQRSLALCCNNLGQLLQKRGDFERAHKQLARALTIQQQLVNQSRSSVTYRADLATTQSNLGMWYSQTGAKQKAADCYQAAISIRESIRKDVHDDAVNLSKLATTYNNLASVFMDGQLAEAQRWIEQAMLLQLNLARLYPHDRTYQSDLALSYNNLGAVHSSQSRWSDAEDCYSDAIDLQRHLIATAPLVAAYRRDLSVSYNNLGMAQSNAGMLDKAEKSFVAALTIQTELVNESPQDVNLLSGLGGIYNNLGMIYWTRRDLPRADEAFQHAITQQRKAHERSPHMASIRDSLNKHYFNRSQVLRALERPVEAAESALARRHLWKGDAQRLFRIAEDLASICKSMPPGAARDRFIDETESTLQEAIAAGPASNFTGNPLDILSDLRGNRFFNRNQPTENAATSRAVAERMP